MQNKDQDVSIFFLDQVVYENWNNVVLNSGIDTICEFSDGNQGVISICPDALDFVIEELPNLLNMAIKDENLSSPLS